MKTKVLIITLIFLLAGSVVLGLTIVNLTQQEAYESAIENNRQFEIDELILEIRQIAHDKNLKTALIPALNSYYGQLTKYYNPFVSETILVVETAKNEKSYKQLELDIVSAAISLENAAIGYDDANMAFKEASKAYNDAISDPAVSSTDELTLKYTMESLKISLHQAENTLDAAQHKLDGLIGQEGTAVLLPTEYSTPYNISADVAYDNALESDIGICQSKRNAEAASIKFEIAAKFYDEDEDMYISALAGLKSADLAYEKDLVSLKMRVLDDIDNLKNKYDSIILAELNKKIKSDAYKAAKTQYSAGILSLTSLEASEESNIAAQKQLDSKTHDYILASMSFTLNYGYEF